MSKRKVLMGYLEEHVPVAVERIHLGDLEAMGIFFAPGDIDTLSESAESSIRILRRTLKPSSAFSIPKRAVSFRSFSKIASLCGVLSRSGVGRLVDNGDLFNAESSDANSSPLGSFSHGGVSLPEGVWSRDSRRPSEITEYAFSWNAGLPGAPAK